MDKNLTETINLIEEKAEEKVKILKDEFFDLQEQLQQACEKTEKIGAERYEMLAKTKTLENHLNYLLERTECLKTRRVGFAQITINKLLLLVIISGLAIFYKENIIAVSSSIICIPLTIGFIREIKKFNEIIREYKNSYNENFDKLSKEKKSLFEICDKYYIEKGIEDNLRNQLTDIERNVTNISQTSSIVKSLLSEETKESTPNTKSEKGKPRIIKPNNNLNKEKQ